MKVRKLERSGLPADRREVQTGEPEHNHFDDMVRPMVHAGLHKRWSTPGSVTAAAGGLMDGEESQEEFERFNALTLARTSRTVMKTTSGRALRRST